MTERPFKKNDVIAYRYQDRRCEAIIHSQKRDGDLDIFAARHPGGKWADYRPHSRLTLDDGDIYDLRLHPEPDRIWAEYAAALLADDWKQPGEF